MLVHGSAAYLFSFPLPTYHKQQLLPYGNPEGTRHLIVLSGGDWGMSMWKSSLPVWTFARASLVTLNKKMKKKMSMICLLENLLHSGSYNIKILFMQCCISI